jgi:long-chain acyl-CoA synthetase
MTPARHQPWLASYQPGVPAQIDLSSFAAMDELLQTALERHASRDAYACRGEVIRFDELDSQTRAVASYLRSLGLPAGARVGLMLPTVLAYPVVLLGILRSGYTAVCINPQYTAPELGHVLADSGAEVLFLAPELAKPLGAVREPHRVARLVLVGAETLGADVPLPWVGLAGIVAAGAGRAAVLPPLRADDVALLQYTGGTTGVSRGAQLTHRNLVANILQAQAWITPSLQAPGPDRQYTFACVLPLHHIFGLTACLLLGAHMGALTVLVANPFDVRGAVAQLAPYRVNLLPAVNTLFGALMTDPRFQYLDFSGLRVCIAGGMKLQPGLAVRWQGLTGCPLVEAYGLSETSPLVCCNPLDGNARPGSIGLPVPGTEVAIMGEHGPLAPGEVGEIAVRGPQVMSGYWNDAAATRAAIGDEGFFLTGDVGAMDDEGFVRIVERKKDVVIVGGFNVYPSEVESAALTHDGVAECACVGVPDANSGEAVKLFVVRKPGAELTAAAVTAHCRQALTAYKLPRHVAFLDALPRTSVGKVSRPNLRALHARETA